MGKERRRDRRHGFKMMVVVAAGRQSDATQTEDVSFNGVFVHLDTRNVSKGGLFVATALHLGCVSPPDLLLSDA